MGEKNYPKNRLHFLKSKYNWFFLCFLMWNMTWRCFWQTLSDLPFLILSNHTTCFSKARGDFTVFLSLIISVGPYNSVPADSDCTQSHDAVRRLWLVRSMNELIMQFYDTNENIQLHSCHCFWVAVTERRDQGMKGLINAVLPDCVNFNCTCLFAVFVCSWRECKYFFTPHCFSSSLRKLSNHPSVCHCVKLWAPLK